jgi:hypothetical protein
VQLVFAIGLVAWHAKPLNDDCGVLKQLTFATPPPRFAPWHSAHDSTSALAAVLWVVTQSEEWPPSGLKTALSFLSPQPPSASAIVIAMIK